MKIQTKLTIIKTSRAESNENKAIRNETGIKKLANVSIKLPQRSMVYFQNINPDIYMKKYLK
jgi:hypothetical protein